MVTDDDGYCSCRGSRRRVPAFGEEHLGSLQLSESWFAVSALLRRGLVERRSLRPITRSSSPALARFKGSATSLRLSPRRSTRGGPYPISVTPRCISSPVVSSTGALLVTRRTDALPQATVRVVSHPAGRAGETLPDPASSVFVLERRFLAGPIVVMDND